MNDELILYEKSDHIATITLNQPATLNALTYDLVVRLRRIDEGQRLQVRRWRAAAQS